MRRLTCRTHSKGYFADFCCKVDGCTVQYCVLRLEQVESLVMLLNDNDFRSRHDSTLPLPHLGTKTQANSHLACIITQRANRHVVNSGGTMQRDQTLRTIYKMSTGKNSKTASLHDQHKLSVIDTTIVALDFYHRGRGREIGEALASLQLVLHMIAISGVTHTRLCCKKYEFNSSAKPDRTQTAVYHKNNFFSKTISKILQSDIFFSFLSWFSCLMFNFFFVPWRKKFFFHLFFFRYICNLYLFVP